MALSKKQIKTRLYRPKKSKPKKRAFKRKGHKINLGRFISVSNRQLIVEMCRIQALKMRLAALEQQLNKTGGFKGKGSWGNSGDKILGLYEQRRQVKKELSELKPFAQDKNTYNCSPYYAAKVLQIRPEIVYQVLRIFAWTGDIKFCRDKRNHLPLVTATENVPIYRDQAACKELHPRSATIEDLQNSRVTNTPRQQDTWFHEHVLSQKRFRNEYGRFLTRFNPKEDHPNLDDYFRITTEESDEPPIYLKTSNKPKILSFKALLEKCYWDNVKAGRVVNVL